MVADLDGDGKVDTVVDGPDIQLGDGAGHFLHTTGSGNLGGSYPGLNIAGDFNGDGRIDLVSLNKDSGAVSLFLGGLTPTVTGLMSPSPGYSPGQSIPLTATTYVAIGSLPYRQITGYTAFKDGQAVQGNVLSSVGFASFPVTGAAPGVHNFTAMYGGDVRNASSTSSVLTLTVAGPPASIAPVSGNNQSAYVESYFVPMQAVVKDAAGNPIAGATVLFLAPVNGPGASFDIVYMNPYLAITNSQGIATAPRMLANRFTGTYAITATVPSTSAVTSFAFTNIVASGAPVAVSVSPNSGAGLQQTFVFQYTSASGGNAIDYVAASFGSLNVNARWICGLTVSTQDQAVTLSDDFGFQGITARVGANSGKGVLSNSQCGFDVDQSSMSAA